MSHELTQELANLGRIGDRIRSIIRETDSLNERGRRLLDTLRWLCPSCGLSACLLKVDRESFGSALDATGTARSEWAEALQEMLQTANGKKPTLLPAAIALPDHSLALEWIAPSERRIGLLALALPGTLSAEIRGILETCVALSSSLLATHLLAEAREARRRRLADEVADLDWLANVGEMAGPIVHEFNNFLNVCLLNVRILEKQLGEAFLADLSSIRLQGAEMADLVKRLQEYRQRNRPPPRPLDLNLVLREALSWDDSASFVRLGVNGSEARIRFEPAADVLPISANGPDLKRLIRILLANCAKARGAPAEISIRTGAEAGKVWLRLEDAAPIAPYFDSHGASQPGIDHLELAACKALVRRLQGTIRAETGPENGMAIVVELPAGSPAS